MDIRKISIGPDYKGSAMHYIVGQKVVGDSHHINLIKFDPETGDVKIFITNEKNETMLWKSFNHNMPVSTEYNIDY